MNSNAGCAHSEGDTIKVFRLMAGMPEIIGEVVSETPEPIETDRGPRVGRVLPKIPRRHCERKSTEAETSPFMMRLLDFAGEGERAPPV